MKLIPRSRRGSLWRFALGSVIVIAFTASATAVAGLLAVADILRDFPGLAIKSKHLTLPAPGAPETLLLIGSDHRAHTSYKTSNTDTMMLVRIDDSSSTINLLSVPRDLRIQVKFGGVMTSQRINATYSIGGPDLLIKTLQDQVFPGLKVNHIVDVNFAGFSDLIDAIGCVYANVDHRYYNNTALTDYSSIDIQPGYQRLCGDNQSPSGALAFVRFRHTDSDLVRNARQQDFVRWTKQGYSLGQLVSDRGRLLRIFGKHAGTDKSLHTTDGLIELFDLILNADKLTLRSIKFPAIELPCNSGGQTPCYVTATPRAERAAYRKFITPTTAQPAIEHKPKPAPRGKGNKRTNGITSGLVADPSDGRSQARLLGHLRLPVLYPRLIVGQASYCFSITANCNNGQEPAYEYAHSYPRRYMIKARNGARFPSYVMTLALNPVEGQYFTVQGTTWLKAPILRSPSETQVVQGKKLFLYEDGGKVSLVAFHYHRAVYWIANTLTDAIPRAQMVGMAASFTPAR